MRVGVRVPVREWVDEDVIVDEEVVDGVGACDPEVVRVGVAMLEGVCEGVDERVRVCVCVTLGVRESDADCVSVSEAVIVTDDVSVRVALNV